MSFDVPILFIIFNRPSYTRIVFDRIKQIKPTRLYIVSDGARPNKNELHNVQECRNIVEQIDWNCEIKTLYRDTNLGSGLGVYEALEWFFNNEDKGIILEDDCLPDLTFFSFCKELLYKYEDNEKIMQISGNNYLLRLYQIKESYYFSQIPLTWGWATWRRAWKKMNYKMKGYREEVDSLPDVSKIFKIHWDGVMDGTGVQDAWDYQWYFSIYQHDGLIIHPKYNLVRNIGFDPHWATHTVKEPWWYKHVHHQKIETYCHPSSIKINKDADAFLEKIFSYQNPTIRQRIQLKLNKHILYKDEYN